MQLDYPRSQASEIPDQSARILVFPDAAQFLECFRENAGAIYSTMWSSFRCMCSLRDEEVDVFFTDAKYPNGLKALTDVKIQVGAPAVASKTLARRCTHGPVGHGLARASIRQASHSRIPAQSSRLSQRWPLDASGRAVICLPCQRAHQYRPYFCVYPLIPVRLVFILVVFGLQLVVTWSSYRSSSRFPNQTPNKGMCNKAFGCATQLARTPFLECTIRISRLSVFTG